MQMNKLLNRLTLVALVLTAIFSQATNVAMAETNLSDLDSDAGYYTAVSVFTTEGVIQGYADGTFKPDKEISRAEALKIILMAFSLDNNLEAELNFSDVDKEAWYAKFLAIGLNEGIVKGYPDGTFKPGNQVSFVEALKMGLVAKGINVDELSYENVHPDLASSEWYSGIVAYAYKSNLFELANDGSIQPGKQLNRAEFTELIYKIRSLPSNGKFDLSYNWTETTGRAAVTTKIPYNWEYYDFGGNGLVAGVSNGNENEKIDFLLNGDSYAKVLLYAQAINEDINFDEYLNEIKQVLNETSGWAFYEEAKLDGKFMIASNNSLGKVNFYFWYDEGQVIIGEGIFSTTNNKSLDYKKFLELIYKNTKPSDLPGVGSIQEKMNEVRKSILVEDAGMKVINSFKDTFVIETDSIGVGTGPVDYYYIPVIDYTLKYERSADMILDIMEGETFNF